MKINEVGGVVATAMCEFNWLARQAVSLKGLLILMLALSGLLLSVMPAQASEAEHREAFSAAKRGDYAAAFRVWVRLAEQGVASAQFNLAVMYDEGLGVAQDLGQAKQWYEKAADQGVAKAQLNLGYMYHKGRGVSQDIEKALSWYRKAADLGHAQAQLSLALLYDQGKGVEQDFKEAFSWYKMAAEQGNAQAQVNLCVLYSNGSGVEKDLVQAYVWCSLASAQGHKTAIQNSEIVEKKMSAREISKAKTEYSQYFEKYVLPFQK